jgi:hypothetical protein
MVHTLNKLLHLLETLLKSTRFPFGIKHDKAITISFYPDFFLLLLLFSFIMSSLCIDIIKSSCYT